MDNKRLKIGFLSSFDPNDRKSSSGTNYMIAHQLKQIGDVSWIPLRRKFMGKALRSILGKATEAGLPDIRMYLTLGTPLYYKFPSADELNKYDVIVAFFCNNILDKIHTDRPIVLLADAMMPILLDYYDFYDNIPRRLKNWICARERESIKHASKIIISSDWGAKGAIAQGMAPENVEMIQFGANIDDKDIASAKRDFDSTNTLRLLFMGVNWERKGGDIAIEATEWLNSEGVPATLKIVGTAPPQGKEYGKNIEICGFKNKNNPEDYKALTDIIRNSDALILPTKAECAGIVFAEAAAYGLPIFTYDTGGTKSYVSDGENGYTLPLTARGADFGKAIKRAWLEGEFAEFSKKGKEIYDSTLNWNVWKKRVEKILHKLV